MRLEDQAFQTTLRTLATKYGKETFMNVVNAINKSYHWTDSEKEDRVLVGRLSIHEQACAIEILSGLHLLYDPTPNLKEEAVKVMYGVNGNEDDVGISCPPNTVNQALKKLSHVKYTSNRGTSHGRN